MSEVNDILKKSRPALKKQPASSTRKQKKPSKKLRNLASCQKKQRQPSIKWLLSSTRCVKLKTLKAAMGELEQHVAQMPLANAKQVVESVGHRDLR